MSAAENGSDEATILIADEIPVEIGIESSGYEAACERAASHGSLTAHFRLGDLQVLKDPQRAASEYSIAAGQGHTLAAQKLGLLLLKYPEWAQSNESDAQYWLEIAANAGELSAIGALADALWQNGDARAGKWLEELARKGDTESMYRLGSMLVSKNSSDGDLRNGVYWLEVATRKGHPKANWLFGRMHSRALFEIPTGVPNSLIQAARLLERAAVLGVAEALYDLARIYKMEGFSGRDLLKARNYLERAAERGVTAAELEVGKRLAKYGNDKASWLEAGKWLSRAAAKGSLEAAHLVRRIADRPPAISEGTATSLSHSLNPLRGHYPAIAARLEVAANFGLNTRETVFIDPLDAYQEWCVKIDLSQHLKQQRWRLVTIESDPQRVAIQRAYRTFFDARNCVGDLKGKLTRARARQLSSVLEGTSIVPELYILDWRDPT